MDIQRILQEQYIDGIEAAEMLNLGMPRVRRLCEEGRFPGAFKWGRSWAIPRASVENFQRLPRGPKTKAQRREEDAALLKSALEEAKGQKEE